MTPDTVSEAGAAILHLMDADTEFGPVPVSPRKIRDYAEHILQDSATGPECTCPANRDGARWHDDTCNVWADNGRAVLAWEMRIAAITAEVYRRILATL